MHHRKKITQKSLFMLFRKDYSMNTFLANFKTFETNSNVFSKIENSSTSFKVGSGRFEFIFIILGRFGTKR